MRGRGRQFVRAVAAGLAACLIGTAAFVAGEHHQQHGVTVLSGLAYVGDHEMSVTVGDWTYGLDGTGNITWVDGQGTTHVGGWPGCLTGPGKTHQIRFGYVPVTTPDGERMRQVVWVDCRS